MKFSYDETEVLDHPDFPDCTESFEQTLQLLSGCLLWIILYEHSAWLHFIIINLLLF